MKIKEIFSLKFYRVDDATSRGAYIWSAVILVLMTGIVVALWGRLPERVPLFFSNPWGEERLARWYMLFMIPAMGVGGGVLNLFLGRRLSDKGDMVVPALAVGTLTINLMLIIGLIGIIRSII